MAARAASSVKRSESPEDLRREAARDPLGLMKRIGCRAILFMKDEQRSITMKWAFRVFCDFRETLRVHRAPVESIASLPHPRTHGRGVEGDEDGGLPDLKGSHLAP